MKKRAAHHKCLFLSSAQKELQEERRAIKDFVLNDPLLRRFFDVFLFEDLPATDRKADDVYLEEVEQCDAYIGLFGNEYGSEDGKGIAPTERELGVRLILRLKLGKMAMNEIGPKFFPAIA